MTLEIRVGSISSEIGSASFVHAFFSTISVHCEPNGWGSRFPHLINELYRGQLSSTNATSALMELKEAKIQLSALPPSKVIWDIENLQTQPPWGTNIATTITNLGNYFVSSMGRDVFEILAEALNVSATEKKDIILE